MELIEVFRIIKACQEALRFQKRHLAASLFLALSLSFSLSLSVTYILSPSLIHCLFMFILPFLIFPSPLKTFLNVLYYICLYFFSHHTINTLLPTPTGICILSVHSLFLSHTHTHLQAQFP